MKRKYISKADLLIVLHYLGYIMQGLGIVLLVPILVALIYGEYIKVSAFFIPCFISFMGFIDWGFNHGSFIRYPLC